MVCFASVFYVGRFSPGTTLWLLSKHLKHQQHPPRVLVSCWLISAANDRERMTNISISRPDLWKRFASWAASTCSSRYNAGVFFVVAKQCWATTPLVLMAKHHVAQRLLARSEGAIILLCYCNDFMFIAGFSCHRRSHSWLLYVFQPEPVSSFRPVTEAYQGRL